MCKSKNKCLNLHCDKCGSNDITKADKVIYIKTELGLSVPVVVYMCHNCHTNFLICPECEGTGFIDFGIFDTDYTDCDTCYGMGLVNLQNIQKVLNFA